MNAPRISASSYSNTEPLIWSFLYGSNHGKVELILDNAPARSAQLLEQGRVDAALVPVIAAQIIEGVRIVPGVCVGARERVRSVCLVTRGADLADVRSVALDVSSKTSAALTKIIFREFLGFEPRWTDAKPDLDAMLSKCDAALLIGDPALRLSDSLAPGGGVEAATHLFPEERWPKGGVKMRSAVSNPRSKIQDPKLALRTFDLAELWRSHTGLGFIFAMWMTKNESLPIDFAAARDEGVSHIADIVTNYQPEIGSQESITAYLSENIAYAPDESMLAGMEVYFSLAAKHGLIERQRSLNYV